MPRRTAEPMAAAAEHWTWDRWADGLCVYARTCPVTMEIESRSGLRGAGGLQGLEPLELALDQVGERGRRIRGEGAGEPEESLAEGFAVMGRVAIDESGQAVGELRRELGTGGPGAAEQCLPEVEGLGK
jgi:hypothetical protein